LRASDKPIAIACLRLLTLPPFPRFPERNVPRFFPRIALPTLFPAALPYFLRLEDFFLDRFFAVMAFSDISGARAQALFYKTEATDVFRPVPSAIFLV
jgi:hypothetical protein